MRTKPKVHNLYGEKARARAAAGSALLDRMVPGWWRIVKLRPLDIGDSCNCVTGQLFGTYGDGLTELGLELDEAKAYGFDTASQDSGSNYWILTRSWKDEIRRRREGEKVGRR